MYILLCTDCYVAREDVSFLHNYDSSFQKRYYKDGGSLRGEIHWEDDKYKIFYLNVEDERVEEVVGQCKNQDWCYVVAEINEQYAMTDNVLYKTERFGWKNIPNNLKNRPEVERLRLQEPQIF